MEEEFFEKGFKNLEPQLTTYVERESHYVKK